MSAPARYWRVNFRSTTGSSIGTQYTLSFGSMRFFTSAGTELTPSLITMTAGNQFSAVTFPLTNLVDGDSATTWVANYPSNVKNNFIGDLYSITFDFGSGNLVLPEYMLVRTLANAVAGTPLSGTIFDFLIDASLDNVTYSRQTLLYRPLPSDGVDHRVPTLASSSLYPFPSAEMIGGAGGIYGIVSEDGVALPNRPVILFERDTFYKVAWATTDVNGGYAFNGLNPAKEFAVMSYDPSGPPYKNALIWDRITPINTLGNITPQSAFWARRTRESSLGGLASMRDYLDGSSANFMAGNIIGNSERRDRIPDGYNFAVESAVGGSLKFLTSSRTISNTGEGLYVQSCVGCFTGVNSAGITANYANLTFEYIVKTPAASDPALYVVWSGTRDSDDTNLSNYDSIFYGNVQWGGGPTIEITPAGVLNVRFPLGARNRSVVRATTNLIPSTTYHIMVTYAQDSEIKLYVNGALVQTTALAGAGRLWGHVNGGNGAAVTTFENWDYLHNGSQPQGPIRRFTSVTVAGPGSTSNNSSTQLSGGPGYGGAWALLALYNRTFSASDVASFYDSYANWDTHTVLPTQSGYMGEVEADNPNFYVRLNDFSLPTRITSLFGGRDYLGTYEGIPVYNATGFVSGSTSVTVSAGAAYFTRVDINSIFTTECFVRPTSISGTQRIWLARLYNSHAVMYFSMISGVLQLNITDVTITNTLIQFSQTLAINTTYHIALSYDPWYTKQCKLYINGVLVQTIAATAIPLASGTWLGVGCNVSGTAPSVSERFQGQMGEFAIYNYVVPAERILAHYDARNS